MPYIVWEDKNGKAVVAQGTVPHDFSRTTWQQRLVEDMTDDLSKEAYDKIQARCDEINKERGL